MNPLRTVAITLIRFYQVSLGPFLGGRCRFYPSCSEYGVQAFTLHPPHKAAWLTARRVCRCQPFGGSGVDPVPEPQPANSIDPAPRTPSDLSLPPQ